MTHAELVRHAVKWLINIKKCKVSFAEPKHTGCTYQPDAIGWHWGSYPANATSFLVECKTSLSDFRADLKKEIHGSLSMNHPGEYRWFLTPDTLRIHPSKVPEGWGMLVSDARGNITEIVKPLRYASPEGHRDPRIALCEQQYLLAALRRVYYDTLFDPAIGKFETVDANGKRRYAARLNKILHG